MKLQSLPTQTQQPHQTPSAMNSINVMNGPSTLLNNSNHIPQASSTGVVSTSLQHQNPQMVSMVPGATPPLAGTIVIPVPQMVPGGSGASGASNDVSSEGMDISGGDVVGASGGSTLPLDPNTVILSKKRLQDLVKEIDPLEVLDEDVEDVLLQMADDFIENVITSSCMMAKHRKSSTLEVKDIQLHLQRNWNIWVPGFGSEELRPYRKAPVTDAHKQRLALIKKVMKKF